MIKIQGKIPRRVGVACSGGPDSMAIVDFLSRNHQVNVLHFNHETEHSSKADQLVFDYVGRNPNLNGMFQHCTSKKPKDKSWEEHWRDERYKFFETSASEVIITCHHLDDCVETWVWSSLHGNGKIIPYRNGKVIRPFRLTRKRDLRMWCDINDIPYIDDPSNLDTSYTRNYIREVMMPHVLKVNPGIHKTISKKVLNDDIG